MQIAICIYRSAKAGKVPDETTRAIDRIFDFVDKSVDAADRVLNGHKHTEEKLHGIRQRGKRRAVIDAVPAEKPKAPSASVVVKRPRFYILESVDSNSGNTIFVVTDGRNARTECATREFAAQILRALEGAP